MQTVLIVIHLMIVLALVVVVLLQKSEGGALGIGGGGGFMAGRSQSNPLTRLTAYLAAGFFVTSMALTIMSGYGGGSVFDRLSPTAPVPQAAPGGPSAPLGTGQGGILDQLKKQSQGQGGAGSPPQPNFAPPSAQTNTATEPAPQPAEPNAQTAPANSVATPPASEPQQPAAPKP